MFDPMRKPEESFARAERRDDEREETSQTLSHHAGFGHSLAGSCIFVVSILPAGLILFLTDKSCHPPLAIGSGSIML